jgi:hypothetical protein
MQERQVIRGFLANIEVIPPLIFTFQFNPESVSDNKAINYADHCQNLSDNAPGKVYTGGGERIIRFDFKLHGLEQGTNALNPTPLDNGISTELAKLRSFLYPREDAWGTLFGGEEGGRRLASPPDCIFGFGTRVLQCVVTELTITETQFNSMLAPVRADVSITLTVIEDSDNVLYQLDKQHRNALAALGLQIISIL